MYYSYWGDNIMKTTEKSYFGWYFLLVIILIYLGVFIFNSSMIIESLIKSLNIFKSLIFVLLLLIILTTIINYFVSSEILVKYMGKNSGIKGIIISIFAGIISVGPIYMWYPLLNDLQQKGVRTSLLVIFLYNRAIKIPLIPMLLVYFSWKYILILFFVMIVMSVVQGFIVERLVDKI